MDKYTVYDLETLSNLYTACFKDYETNGKKEFVIHESQNDFVDMMRFLKSLRKHEYKLVGFNCNQFDGQILAFLFNRLSAFKHLDGDQIARKIFKFVQQLLSIPEDEKFRSLLPEWELPLEQVDVYRQCHYDSKNKRTSLKWLQFTMRFPNIESMPVHHTAKCSAEDIPLVLSYNWNDVDSTGEFFKRMKHETDLRITMSNQFGRNLLNASEPRMAREIFGTKLADAMGIPYRELKELRTYRKQVRVKDVIFPYISFKDPTLQAILKFFQGLRFDPYDFKNNNYELETVEKIFKYHNITDMTVGLGGIHGCIKPGVYTSNEEWVIEDIDGKSYYPNLGIKNRLYPEHLSPIYCEVYEGLYNDRQKIPKSDPMNYIYKIILNSTYGLSKEPNNYFHDPKYTFAITVNGQLLLLKLGELIKEHVPGVVFYQFNTDGVSIGYHPQYKNKVEEVKALWTKKTKIELENKFYTKMVILDVNNYMAQDAKDGKIKRKGRFGYSLNPEDVEMFYHKNPSALVIPKALEQHYFYNVDYRKYIRDCKDIYDFCLGVKVKRDFDVHLHSYNKETQQIDKQKLTQQVIRYYVSTRYESIKKQYKPGSKKYDNVKKKKKDSGAVEFRKGYNTTYFNKFVDIPFDQYDIDYSFYEKMVSDIIYEINPHANQLKLL